MNADWHMRAVEQQVQDFLTSLFPGGWHGWSFYRSDDGSAAIDVYQCEELPTAVGALHRAGFALVTLHMHEASKLITCGCRRHEAEG